MPFHAIPFMDDAVEIHRLIRHGAPLADISEELETHHTANLRAPSGKTPLMTAAYFCRKDVLELLIRHGAVVNALHEVTGDTAAHFLTLSLAGHVKQAACLMVLVDADADVDLRNYDGYTVFELASKNGNPAIGNSS